MPMNKEQPRKRWPDGTYAKEAHTPGPWAVYAGKGKHGERFIINETSDFVAAAQDFNSYDRDDEVDANARLIAAAPELLDALYGIGVHPEFGFCCCLNQAQQDAGHTGECKAARAAIAKSGGGR